LTLKNTDINDYDKNDIMIHSCITIIVLYDQKEAFPKKKTS